MGCIQSLCTRAPQPVTEEPTLDPIPTPSPVSPPPAPSTPPAPAPRPLTRRQRNSSARWTSTTSLAPSTTISELERASVGRPWGDFAYQRRPAAPHCPAGRTMEWQAPTKTLTQGKRPDRRRRRLHVGQPHRTAMRDGSTWTSYPTGWARLK
jgi:hypothetical protein